jgi:uncharacterized membrane protein
MGSTMQERPAIFHLVMLSFDGEDTAAAVVRRLRGEGALHGCEIAGEALVSRDRAGIVHAHERGATGIGVAFGAATAGFLGFFPGPMLLPLLIVAGAIVGGVAGHFAGQALPKEDLREVGESLPPGTSAFVAVVDTAHADQLVDAFAAEGARVLNVPVETSLASVIREGITGHIRRV